MYNFSPKLISFCPLIEESPNEGWHELVSKGYIEYVRMGERDAVPGTRFRVNILGEQPTGDGVYSMHGYNKKVLQLGI